MSRPLPETLRAVLAAVLAGMVPLRAVPPMRLSEWAAKHFRLSAEASHTSGQWKAFPFQIGWMDAFSNDDIEEVTVRKAKRVGYTKTLTAFIAYNAAHRRRKQALWQPTDDDRDSFVKSEIDPMLRDVAAMRPVLLSGKEDTLKMKQFLGNVALNYQVVASEQTSVMLYAGTRINWLEAEISLEGVKGNDVNQSGDEFWMDAIVGVRLRQHLAGPWFLEIRTGNTAP